MQLMVSFIVSTVGLGYFIYGKKAVRFGFLGAGLVLMIFPYFVASLLLTLLIAAVLLVVSFFIHV